MLAMLPLALVALAFAAPARAAEPRVTVAMLPEGTGVESLAAAVPRFATGVMSAGLGRVPAAQTYLDMGQGTRLFSSLYPDLLTPLYVDGNRVPSRLWNAVVERAQGAPATIVPGLLASSLEEHGVRIASRPLTGSPALIAADRSGLIRRAVGCRAGSCPGVTITSSGFTDLARIASRMRPRRGDLLIAIERPPPSRDLLAIGIAGAGFDGHGLTSDSTRMDGYVLATDLLPTILAAYGIEVPASVGGRRIVRTEGSLDAAAVTDLERRLGQVGERRSGVLGANLLAWIGLCLAAIALVPAAARAPRRRVAALALSVLAITAAYVPFLLLITAALRPSELAERLAIGLGAPLLAALTIVLLRGRFGVPRAVFGAFAAAAAASIGATGIDMLAGSPLTALSLLGPNPGLGVRFFGIGNELEATIGVLLMLGTGAAVSALAPAEPRRAVAIAAVAVTIPALLVFAPGRFGADVGAAITFPLGAAVCVIAALRLSGRRAVLVLAAPVIALAALVAFDIAIPGDSHLSRSVLEAAGMEELGDVFDRRLTLAARSFPRYIDSPFFLAALTAIALAIVFRRRVAGWFAGRPAAAAGLAGALGATAIGTLANDSAALLLMVGAGFSAAFCGLAWGARELARPTREPPPAP